MSLLSEGQVVVKKIQLLVVKQAMPYLSTLKEEPRNVKSFMEDTDYKQIVHDIGEVEDELMEDITWVNSVD